MDLLGVVTGANSGEGTGDDRIVVRCEVPEGEFTVAEDIGLREAGDPSRAESGKAGDWF